MCQVVNYELLGVQVLFQRIHHVYDELSAVNQSSADTSQSGQRSRTPTPPAVVHVMGLSYGRVRHLQRLGRSETIDATVVLSLLLVLIFCKDVHPVHTGVPAMPLSGFLLQAASSAEVPFRPGRLRTLEQSNPRISRGPAVQPRGAEVAPAVIRCSSFHTPFLFDSCSKIEPVGLSFHRNHDASWPNSSRRQSWVFVRGVVEVPRDDCQPYHMSCTLT